MSGSAFSRSSASRMDSVFPISMVVGVALSVFIGACEGDKGGGPEDGLVREELGSFTTDTGSGADVPFEVPTDAYSAQVTCGPYGYDVLATAESILDPSGAAIYDYNDGQGTAMRVATTDDLLPVLFPVSPDLDVGAGIYTMRVYVDLEQPTTITCNALYRIQEPAAGQTVDIHFVFVGVDGEVPGLNATDAVDSTVLNTTLDRVEALWADLGLSVGVVTYEDFAGDVATYNSVDGAKEFGDLLRTSTSDDRAITVFLVSAITDNDGATILGQAAGPPGAAATGGTSKSGAVVTVGPLAESDTDTEARIIAHEVAHFMGLYHPTEKDGSAHDPLLDTPECTSDTDSNGVYSTSECLGQGADYLMWWAASATSVEASANQAWVVQRSALPQ